MEEEHSTLLILGVLLTLRCLVPLLQQQVKDTSLKGSFGVTRKEMEVSPSTEQLVQVRVNSDKFMWDMKEVASFRKCWDRGSSWEMVCSFCCWGVRRCVSTDQVWVVCLKQGAHMFSTKGQSVCVLSFAFQLSSLNSPSDVVWKPQIAHKCGHIPVRLHPQKQAHNEGTVLYACDPSTWGVKRKVQVLQMPGLCRNPKLSVAVRWD